MSTVTGAKIIDGRRYNSETADHLADASARCPRNDFRFWEESLYRTKSGSYFLCGSGGPMTTWASHYGNSLSNGSGLRVLDESEAREWVERYANANYERIFGPAQEG